MRLAGLGGVGSGMKVRSVAVVVGALTALAGQVVQGPAASAGSDRGGRDADLAAIEKLHQLGRPVAWTNAPSAERREA